MMTEKEIETAAGTDGVVVWLTGLSGAGKTTLAHAVHRLLEQEGVRAEVLDGDVLRSKLGRGLGFSREDRDENVRRIAFVANLLAKHGVVVLVAVIAPYRETREEIRKACCGYIEVFVDAPLGICEERDPKGLYRRARQGEIAHFTGIDDPYESPLDAEVCCHTDTEAVEESAARVVGQILEYRKSAGRG